MSARLRISLLAAAGLFLLQLGWILSLPPHVGIDEFDHALRANSVAEGHWGPANHPLESPWGRGDLIPVRADVAASVRAACELRSSYTGVLNCQPAQDLGNGSVLIGSAAGRYNPVYYAFAGLAAAPFHADANLYALRIATALLSSALFFLTVWLAAGFARTRWPVAVLMISILPTTLYSTAVAAPNGGEMLAGLGTWVALLALADQAEARAGQRRPAYLLLGLFVAVLANLHTLGLLWLALIAVTVAVLHGPLTTLKILRPRGPAEIAAAALTTLAVVFELAWVLESGVNDATNAGLNVAGTPTKHVVAGLFLWPLQAIGAYPLRNEPAPMAVYALVVAVIGVVAVLAMRRTPVRSRAALAFAFALAASFLVPAVLTVMSYGSIGAAWQGRYGMPFTVGLLVLAGRQIDRSDRAPSHFRALAATGAVLLVMSHLIGQWAVTTRMRSMSDLMSATDWVPPSPVLLMVLSGLAAAAWLWVVRAEPDDRVAGVLVATGSKELVP